jgi:hypothetical protein
MIRYSPVAERAVLLRNPNIDSLTKDILGYFERCLKHGQSAINFGFIAGRQTQKVGLLSSMSTQNF